MSLVFTNIAKEDVQTVSNTVQHILSESASTLTNGEVTTYSIISKNAFKFILPCLRHLECNEKIKYAFNERRENLF